MSKNKSPLMGAAVEGGILVAALEIQKRSFDKVYFSNKGVSRMPYCDLKNVKLHYELFPGDRELVTLVSGHMRTLRDFYSLAKFLVKNQHSVLVLDNRGVGLTECSLDFSLDDLAGDILALWQEVGVRRSHIVGFSMGGLVAQVLARSRPEQLISMTLVSSFSLSRISEKSAASLAEWPSTVDEIESFLGGYVSERFVDRNQPLIKAMARQIHREIFASNFLSRAKAQRNAIVQYRFFERVPNPEILRNLRVQIVHGGQDTIVPPKESEYLAAEYDQPRKVDFSEDGHLLLAENPTKLFGVILKHVTGDQKGPV